MPNKKPSCCWESQSGEFKGMGSV